MNQSDFLDDLAELALGSRLKRLSDRLLADAAKIYKICEHDVQPKWFALLALLYQKETTSIVEAAESLGVSQPAISQFVKEMLSKGLIISTPSSQDSRRKFISLSERGHQKVLAMLPMWRAVEQAAKELCLESGDEVFESIKRLEKSLDRQTLLQRTLSNLEDTPPNSKVEIVEFSEDLADHFKSINEEWIDEMFEIEASDREILNHPQEIVINNGGKIYFAKIPHLGIVGTCALLKKDTNSFELTKMGVVKQARGHKVGEVLLKHVIEQANKLNIKNLYLLTNSKCEAAIHLYLKFGFQHDVETMDRYASKYERCNVAMRYFG